MSDQGQDVRQTCSINGKLCVNGLRSDFEKDPITGQPRPCHKWVRLVGKDPTSEKTIDEWCCNEWAKVKIGIEGCQMTRHVTAAVDKVARETRKVGMVAAGGEVVLPPGTFDNLAADGTVRLPVRPGPLALEEKRADA